MRGNANRGRDGGPSLIRSVIGAQSKKWQRENAPPLSDSPPRNPCERSITCTNNCQITLINAISSGATAQNHTRVGTGPSAGRYVNLFRPGGKLSSISCFPHHILMREKNTGMIYDGPTVHYFLSTLVQHQRSDLHRKHTQIVFPTGCCLCIRC